jgi:hypothetical protein
MFCVVLAAAVHVPGLHHRRDLIAKRSTKMQEDTSAKAVATASCPLSNGNGPTKLLFNHIAKTGGTAVKHVLRQLVPKKDLTIQDDIMADARLTSTDKENFFVIGLVRRPCDFLVSWYYQLKPHHPGIGDFEPFVNDVVTADSNEYPRQLMTKALSERYVSGDNVHCMMHTHALEAGLSDCMQKFAACGGAILGANDTQLSVTSIVQGALSEAVDIAHSAGRSVGNHPACKSLFNKDMETKVLATEQTLVNEYGLETCCS